MNSEEESPKACESRTLKKQKVDDAAAHSSDDDNNSDSYFSDSDFKSKERMEEYRCYVKQIGETEGFGVEVFPNVRLFGRIYPLDLTTRTEHAEQVQKCTLYAINEHNRTQDANLEFEAVVKATYGLCSGSLYYITFVAVDSFSGKKNIYQTKVHHGLREYLGMHGMSVKLFRLKPFEESELFD